MVGRFAFQPIVKEPGAQRLAYQTHSHAEHL